MDIRSLALGTGIVLLILAGAVLTLNPSEEATEPETGFNVEVSSHSDGDADFIYKPTTNGTLDVLISYNITVDDQLRDSVKNRRIESVSKDQPVTVIVGAEPDQLVQVRMNITDTEGKLLHQSQHAIGPAEN